MITLIAAVNNKGVIGVNNTLPWRNKEDLNHFRVFTMNKTIVMGRKTYESLPGELDGRKILVASRVDGDILDLGAFLRKHKDSDDDIIIAGGAQIYEWALPYVSKMLISHIDDDTDGDTYFPKFDESNFRLKERNFDTFVLKEYDRINIMNVTFTAKTNFSISEYETKQEFDMTGKTPAQIRDELESAAHEILMDQVYISYKTD